MSKLIREYYTQTNCSFNDCKKPKEKSGFCKVHEVTHFLMNFKQIVNQKFGSVEAGLLQLEKHSGQEISEQDLFNFFNFIHAPFSTENAASTVRALGHNRKRKSCYIMDIKSLRRCMDTPDLEDSDLELKMHMFQINIQKAFADSKQPISVFLHDLEENGCISIEKLTDMLNIDQRSIKHYFQQNFGTSTITSFDLASVLNPLVTNYTRDETIALGSNEKQSVYKGVLIVDFFSQLKKSYENVRAAYEAICTTRTNSLNYFKIQRSIKQFGLQAEEYDIKQIIRCLGQGSTYLPYIKFKQLWSGKDKVCCRYDCLSSSLKNSQFCKAHIKINQNRSRALVQEIQKKTRTWKSCRVVKNYFSNLENAKCSGKDLKIQIGKTIPASFVTEKEAKQLQSYLRAYNSQRNLQEDFSEVFTPRNFPWNPATPKGPGFYKISRVQSARTRKDRLDQPRSTRLL